MRLSQLSDMMRRYCALPTLYIRVVQWHASTPPERLPRRANVEKQYLKAMIYLATALINSNEIPSGLLFEFVHWFRAEATNC